MKKPPQRKIHIVYNAKEERRILSPIFREKPDIIYYFHHEGDNVDINEPSRIRNLIEIRKKLPECTIIEDAVSYVDYYAVIGKLARIFSQEQDQDTQITINLGTGSKMVALANNDAHRLWGGRLTYPYSLDYDPSGKSTHTGKIRAAQLPNLEFRTPTIHLIKALQILYWLMTHDRHGREDRNFVVQKEWQTAIYETYHIHSVLNNPDPRRKGSSQITSLNRIFVVPLRDIWKYITQTKVGRGYHIYFTDNGLKVAKIFMNYDYGLQFTNKTIQSE
jgi:hypothetical protein